MPNPVVHFEIMGKDAARTQGFYSNLFGWKVDANNPQNYGMVDNNGEGINGGLAGYEGDPPRTTLYVQVPDLQAYLDTAEKLGGKTVMPPTEIPGSVTFAMFADPDGNTIGMIKGE
jgi:predicted enzyme related to lactoylglutathione lyase